MKTIDHIIERLEMRRVAVDGLICTWCPCCFRVILKNPAVKRSFECIWVGEENCRQPIKTGPISEAIADLRASQ